MTKKIRLDAVPIFCRGSDLVNLRTDPKLTRYFRSSISQRKLISLFKQLFKRFVQVILRNTECLFINFETCFSFQFCLKGLLFIKEFVGSYFVIINCCYLTGRYVMAYYPRTNIDDSKYPSAPPLNHLIQKPWSVHTVYLTLDIEDAT